jgi:hypothetical protein
VRIVYNVLCSWAWCERGEKGGERRRREEGGTACACSVPSGPLILAHHTTPPHLPILIAVALPDSHLSSQLLHHPLLHHPKHHAPQRRKPHAVPDARMDALPVRLSSPRASLLSTFTRPSMLEYAPGSLLIPSRKRRFSGAVMATSNRPPSSRQSHTAAPSCTCAQAKRQPQALLHARFSGAGLSHASATSRKRRTKAWLPAASARPSKKAKHESSVSGNALFHVWLTDHVAGPTGCAAAAPAASASTTLQHRRHVLGPQVHFCAHRSLVSAHHFQLMLVNYCHHFRHACITQRAAHASRSVLHMLAKRDADNGTRGATCG